MISYRVIARLDIKGEKLIKGYQMEGLRALGDPAEFARRYADDGADEIAFFDTVASLYGRSHIREVIDRTSASAFIPLLVAGGVQSADGVADLLRCGADRVALNSAAIRDPRIIAEIAARIGCQGVAVSIEAKRTPQGWEAYTDCGRIPSGRCALAWAKEAVSLGAGEIFVTSVDRDGTRTGPDWALLMAVHALDLDVPMVYSGGIRLSDVAEISKHTQGLAIGAGLHYGDFGIGDVKRELKQAGRIVR